jgi:hypothetical protein
MIKSRRMRRVGHTVQMREERGMHLDCSLIKPEGRRLLGRSRHRWVDNIKMDLEEIRWGDVDWIGLAQNRYKWRALVNAIMNLWDS